MAGDGLLSVGLYEALLYVEFVI